MIIIKHHGAYCALHNFDVCPVLCCVGDFAVAHEKHQQGDGSCWCMHMGVLFVSYTLVRVFPQSDCWPQFGCSFLVTMFAPTSCWLPWISSSVLLVGSPCAQPPCWTRWIPVGSPILRPCAAPLPVRPLTCGFHYQCMSSFPYLWVPLGSI